MLWCHCLCKFRQEVYTFVLSEFCSNLCLQYSTTNSIALNTLCWPHIYMQLHAVPVKIVYTQLVTLTAFYRHDLWKISLCMLLYNMIFNFSVVVVNVESETVLHIGKVSMLVHYKRWGWETINQVCLDKISSKSSFCVCWNNCNNIWEMFHLKKFYCWTNC